MALWFVLIIKIISAFKFSNITTCREEIKKSTLLTK